MLFNPQLIQKYDKPGPRYTSYPPATFFKAGIDQELFREHIIASNQCQPRNLSFYFHVPFCPQLCNFCGCNTGAMPRRDYVELYMKTMMREFETVAQWLDASRPVTQIHWGGGTPNAISMKLVGEVMSLVRKYFTLADDAEVAMECNPAYVSYNQIDELVEMGFNRISLGIQDFDAEVLRRIHRQPSRLPVADLVKYMQQKNIRVNLDFVYGLPGQTPESFENTIFQAYEANPDRIVTFSYAHVPWVKAAQKELEQYTIPQGTVKLEMFRRTYEKLTRDGYMAIGLDHFAKPDDEMAQALTAHSLHRNFMGYCTISHTGQVYAFGASSITQLDDAYFQNHKDTQAYIDAIAQHETAVDKGYVMTDTDKLCRAVIQEIMCNHFVDLDKMALRFHLSYDALVERLGFEPDALQSFIEDDLVKWENHQLAVFPQGRMFLRNVAMLFDPLYSVGTAQYSRTV
jgi:oxygen-independent coproporphyrinogen III oxidase